ncbi:MAG: Rrf2 family transcriptional regulator [Candidatus Zixiibacteriota bacterium]|nr:MAG: Rrf2 family transcriptional regulator [candidate division Zixibacteria bacterium]
MLKITEAASLAIHTAAYMAAQPERRFTTREVAALFRISENHLSKVMQRLVKVGLVTSVRGPRGGFNLTRPPDQVTLLHVYEAIEGAFDWNRCLLGHDVCPVGTCLMGQLLENVNRTVYDYLSGTTLAQLGPAFQQVG